jgi:2,4-diaminopentanoate dehydrogenase
MPEPLRVVQYGLGPIGLETARTVLQKSQTGRMELVGAIDIDPEKAGRDVAELLGLDVPTGVTVSADADAVLANARPDVVLHTTSSFLDRVGEQLEQCARAGAHVVSSTEELAYPFDRHPAWAERLDRTAREHGVVIVGTGVNPGYAMDALALAATGVCTEVRGLRVERTVDAAGRRLPLQRKVGAGITEEEFAERKAAGTFGHIGLRESLLLVAAGLGWRLDEVEETLEPVLARERVRTPFLTVEAGQVAGIHHAVRGRMGGAEVLVLDLKMYVGAPTPSDVIVVDGTPPLRLVAENGIFGDTATVGALVNTAGVVLQAQPGLRTVKDLPVPRAFATALSTPPLEAATPPPSRNGAPGSPPLVPLV